MNTPDELRAEAKRLVRHAHELVRQARVMEIHAWLEINKVPLDAGRPRVARLLSDAGRSADNNVLAIIVKERKQRLTSDNTVLQTARSQSS